MYNGFVTDYSNTTLLKEFSEYLKDYSVKNKISFITIDCDININKNQLPVKSGHDIKENLIKAGFKFAETAEKNFNAIQPNFSFRLDIEKKENETVEETKDRIFNGFDKKWKYNINLGKKRGLEVEWYDQSNITDEVLDEFQRIMDITGKRDNFLVRKRPYFENLIKNVSPYARIYLVKYNMGEDVRKTTANIDELNKELFKTTNKIKVFIDKLDSNNPEETPSVNQVKNHNKNLRKVSDLTEKIDRLTERLDRLNEKINQLGTEEIYLSGALYLVYGDKAWYLYGASSNDFREVMPNFTMQWAMISDSIDMGKNIYDFRGVSGDLNESNPLYGLYKFKKGFGGDFVEFIGEADLITDRLTHKMFKEFFPKYKKIRAMLTK